MIFVTVGNATQSFHRLLNSIEALAVKGCFGDDAVLIQSGHNNDFIPTCCSAVPFLAPDQYAKHIRDADVIVCHGGAGTLHHVFQVGKRPVVMPRRKKYSEHIDDQYELVRNLALKGLVIPAYEPEDLLPAIVEARNSHIGPFTPSKEPPMVFLIDRAIEELFGRK
jgi:UDP-N-acetylglucosamine transferase subunit ALG13